MPRLAPVTTTHLPSSRPMAAVSARASGLHQFGEALHALEGLVQSLAPEVEDQLAHAEAPVGGDVVEDLARFTAERTPLTPRTRRGGVVHGRLVGNREGRWIAAFLFGQPMKLVERGAQLGRGKRHRRIGAYRMPAVAVPRDAAQGGRAMPPDPDRRVWLLDGSGQAAERAETIEAASEGRRILRPQRLEDPDVLVAHRTPAVEVRRAQRLELLPQPAHADAHRHAAPREHVDGRQRL